VSACKSIRIFRSAVRKCKTISCTMQFDSLKNGNRFSRLDMKEVAQSRCRDQIRTKLSIMSL
jgi:hypothetical protein